jgi:hypothetical protein
MCGLVKEGHLDFAKVDQLVRLGLAEWPLLSTSPAGQPKVISPYRTGLYTLSHLVVLNALNVGHPAEA